MPTAHEPLAMYLHLARASQQRRQPLVRDKLLVLAGAVAAERGLMQVAACCRRRVLDHNAGHLLSRYASFTVALADENFQTYLRKLRRDFPLEKAEHMLSSLGIELAGERQTYYTEHEYAAALLGISLEELDQQFGPNKHEVPTSPTNVATDGMGVRASAGPQKDCQRLPIIALAVLIFAALAIALLFWR